MNKYSCLRQALSFVCPICLLNNCIKKDYFEFKLTQAQTLKIDIDNNKIIDSTIESEFTEYATKKIRGGSGSRINYYDIAYNGASYAGASISCVKCFQYEFTVQMSINYELYMIEDLIKNSEVVTIEENNSTHEIMNSYMVNRTIYRNNKDKSINLPLVSDDLLNPKETLQKIKKLILFI